MWYRPFKKGFIDEDGEFEEIYDYGTGKLSGYGVGYSHPRHLNQMWGCNIKSFKDMDKVLDQRRLIRVLDDRDTFDINIGNTASEEQLKIIENIFKTNTKQVRAKITSISRKYYKSFDKFMEAYKKHSGISPEDKGNKEFLTHTQRLSA